MIGKVIYFALLMVIGGVSVYDAYLNLKYPVTCAVEKNPIASVILYNSDLPTLISVKFAGTLLAMMVLVCLYRTKYAFAVAIPLAIFQIFVILYITKA